MTPEQVAKIRAKVESCFQKVTPDRPVYASYFSKAINDPNLTPKKEEPLYGEYLGTFKFPENPYIYDDNPVIPRTSQELPKFQNPFEGAANNFTGMVERGDFILAPACASSEGQFLSC